MSFGGQGKANEGARARQKEDRTGNQRNPVVSNLRARLNTRRDEKPSEGATRRNELTHVGRVRMQYRQMLVQMGVRESPKLVMYQGNKT